jgi:PmbA protein
MEIAYYILKELKKKGADDIIIGVNKTEASQIKFSDNKVVKTGSELLVNLDIFMAKDKKIIVTSVKDFNKGEERTMPLTSLKKFDKKNADRIIDNLINFSKNIRPNKDYNGIAQGPFKYKEIKNKYDKNIIDVDEVDLMQKGINAALENSNRTNGIIEKYITNNLLITSNNIHAEDKSTGLYFSIRAFTDKEASGHMNSCSRILSKFDVYGAGKLAGAIAKLAHKPEEESPGKYDVVFSYMPMAALLNNIMICASIFEVESGLSFLANKLNKKLGRFTLIDQGNLENGFNSSKFDNEGVPTKKNYIIKDGILKTYLHNTSTAKKYKTKTTANAGLIAPTPTNIILEGKKGNVFDIKKGLYITNVWYTRFQNHLTGDFSTIPRDGIFLIKNGEIIKSLKNIRISDNFLNLMNNVSLVGKESKHLKSWEAETPVVTPEVLIKNVNISKPKL